MSPLCVAIWECEWMYSQMILYITYSYSIYYRSQIYIYTHINTLQLCSKFPLTGKSNAVISASVRILACRGLDFALHFNLLSGLCQGEPCSFRRCWVHGREGHPSTGLRAGWAFRWTFWQQGQPQYLGDTIFSLLFVHLFSELTLYFFVCCFTLLSVVLLFCLLFFDHLIEILLFMLKELRRNSKPSLLYLYSPGQAFPWHPRPAFHKHIFTLLFLVSTIHNKEQEVWRWSSEQAPFLHTTYKHNCCLYNCMH